MNGKNVIIPGINCTQCGSAYPLEEVPYCCPFCGGLYEYRGGLQFDPAKADPSQPGIWRYRYTFGLPPEVEPISLGEGNTPLIWANAFNRQIAFKCEFINPSGSFKDRGSSVITAWLKGRSVTEAVEDSSGNAGASFAAYAARAGIKARIYVPETASGPKRRQIEAYGAELVPISGSRSDVSEVVRKVAESGVAYASHAYLPFNLPGYATAAYEIFEQLGRMPGSVVVPAGQGGFLLGLAYGFDALQLANSLDVKPQLIGVQARACAPLWVAYENEDKNNNYCMESHTLAEGVRVSNPLRKDAVLKAVIASGGFIHAVQEKEILAAGHALAGLGFYVEPTSAIVWAALDEIADVLPDPLIVILTGSGMKYG